MFAHGDLALKFLVYSIWVLLKLNTNEDQP